MHFYVSLHPVQASSFGLQLSRCQKATGALNSRNTSATVKLKPRGVFSGSNRPLKSVGLISSFNPSPELYVFPPQKGTQFFEKGNESSKPKPKFVLKGDMFVFRVDRACIPSKKWKLMICYAKSVAAFGSCGENGKYLPVN